MEFVLSRDVASVLQLAQPLWMLTSMLSVASSRVTIFGSRSRRFGKSTRIFWIQPALIRPNCFEEYGYVLGGGPGEIEAILGIEQRASFPVDGRVRPEELRCELLS